MIARLGARRQARFFAPSILYSAGARCSVLAIGDRLIGLALTLQIVHGCDMQLLAANFSPEHAKCTACHGRLHRHGHYARRRKPEQRIPRWFCRRCHCTFSILPADGLPYRNLSCSELQKEFDGWAFEERAPATKPAAAALRRFLKPSRQLELQHVFGQWIEEAAATGQALWRGMRRCIASVEALLPWLADRGAPSLLGSYVCQREAQSNRRAAPLVPSPPSPPTIPHTFASHVRLRTQSQGLGSSG